MPSKTLYKTTAILFSHSLALGVQRRDSGLMCLLASVWIFQVGELEWLGVTWPGGEETTGVENPLCGWLPCSGGTWPGMTWRPGSPGAVDTCVLSHRAEAVTGWQFLESGCSDTERERADRLLRSWAQKPLSLLHRILLVTSQSFIHAIVDLRGEELNSASWGGSGTVTLQKSMWDGKCCDHFGIYSLPALSGSRGENLNHIYSLFG